MLILYLINKYRFWVGMKNLKILLKHILLKSYKLHKNDIHSILQEKNDGIGRYWDSFFAFTYKPQHLLARW